MIVVQNSEFPGGVRNAIVDLIPRDIARLDVASAYVTRSGCNLLFSAIRDLAGEATFELMPKVLITSPDYGLTEPEALYFWAGLGSTPILRTLSLSPILGQRSVHVQAQALQP
jgi:hypothetical protein